MQIIRQSAMNEKNETSDKLREYILNHFLGEVTPSKKALEYVSREVKELFS